MTSNAYFNFEQYLPQSETVSFVDSTGNYLACQVAFEDALARAVLSNKENIQPMQICAEEEEDEETAAQQNCTTYENPTQIQQRVTQLPSEDKPTISQTEGAHVIEEMIQQALQTFADGDEQEGEKEGEEGDKEVVKKRRPTCTPSAVTNKRRLRGFANLGNTCFLNTALQCFLHSPGVEAQLRKNKAKIAGLLLQLLEGERGSATIEALIQYIEYYHDLGDLIKQLTEQYDVGLFLFDILFPALQKEGATAVCRPFTLRTSEQILFRETGHSREVIIDRECLHVEVPHEINLAEALKAAVPEQISDDLFLRFCSYSYPKNLVLRFNYLSGRARLTDFAAYLTDTLQPIRKAAQLTEDITKVYKLYAISVHVGNWGMSSPPSYGHYYAFLRVGQDWKKLDDNRVWGVSCQEVTRVLKDKHHRPILCFYQRIKRTKRDGQPTKHHRLQDASVNPFAEGSLTKRVVEKVRRSAPKMTKRANNNNNKQRCQVPTEYEKEDSGNSWRRGKNKKRNKQQQQQNNKKEHESNSSPGSCRSRRTYNNSNNNSRNNRNNRNKGKTTKISLPWYCGNTDNLPCGGGAEVEEERVHTQYSINRDPPPPKPTTTSTSIFQRQESIFHPHSHNERYAKVLQSIVDDDTATFKKQEEERRQTNGLKWPSKTPVRQHQQQHNRDGSYNFNFNEPSPPFTLRRRNVKRVEPKERHDQSRPMLFSGIGPEVRVGDFSDMSTPQSKAYPPKRSATGHNNNTRTSTTTTSSASDGALQWCASATSLIPKQPLLSMFNNPSAALAESPSSSASGWNWLCAPFWKKSSQHEDAKQDKATDAEDVFAFHASDSSEECSSTYFSE